MTFGSPGGGPGGARMGPHLGPPPGTPEIHFRQETIVYSDKTTQVHVGLHTKTGPPAGPGRGPVRRQVAPSAFRDFRGFPRFSRLYAISSDFPSFSCFRGFRTKTEPPSRRARNHQYSLGNIGVLRCPITAKSPSARKTRYFGEMR